LVVVAVLLLAQLVLIVLNRFSGLLMLLILVLVVVNYFLWRQDEAYFTARESEAPSAGEGGSSEA
jgi:hypothetical protein